MYHEAVLHSFFMAEYYSNLQIYQIVTDQILM